MFRGAINKLSLRKKLTILATVGVLLPLLVLTYLQYRSLTELQDKTKGAFKDNLRQGLTVVEQAMKQRLEAIAAQTLNPIGSLDLSTPAAVENHFANIKRAHPEIDEIFVFVDSQNAYVYSDRFAKIAQADFTAAQSNVLSVYAKSRMGQSFVDGNQKYLFAHDSCPACPPNMREGNFLFYPLKGGNGFAGVLLNQRFVNDDLIVGTIKVIAASHSQMMAMTITDESQRVLYSNGTPQDGYLLETNFDPPFSSWKAAGSLAPRISANAAQGNVAARNRAVILVVIFMG